MKRRRIWITVCAVVLAGVGVVLWRGYRAYQEVRCLGNLKALGSALAAYGNNHDDALPTPERWCDILIEGGYAVPEGLHCCAAGRFREGASEFVLNKHLDPEVGFRAPAGIVLIFEGPSGWNQVGGPEDMRARHSGKCCVLFTDGYFACLPLQEARRLNWETEDRGKASSSQEAVLNERQ